MVIHKTIIRVRYADTDQMGFVYNGKYLEYFEVGRTELLRNCGLSYNQVEEAGYQLPLTETGLKYKAPAYYDDELEIEARLEKLHVPKVYINYRIYRKGETEILTEGFTEHIFIKTDTKKAVRPPKIYVDALAEYFK